MKKNKTNKSPRNHLLGIFFLLFLLALSHALSTHVEIESNIVNETKNASFKINISTDSIHYITFITPPYLGADVNESLIKGNKTVKVIIYLKNASAISNMTRDAIYLLIKNDTHVTYIPLVVRFNKTKEESSPSFIFELEEEKQPIEKGLTIYIEEGRKSYLPWIFLFLFFLFSAIIYFLTSSIISFKTHNH